jgi:hypothetical protein
MKITFTMKEEHLKLLRAMNVDWDSSEFGAPGIDPKRPYGNGDAIRDIANILGVELQYDAEGVISAQQNYLHRLHLDTGIALQVVLATGEFSVGQYEADLYDRNWRKV